jgi:hypothetical protein
VKPTRLEQLGLLGSTWRVGSFIIVKPCSRDIESGYQTYGLSIS